MIPRLWGIFRFELAYQLRRPWPWLMSGVLLVVCFLMTRDAAVADALYDEFYVNAPFNIAITTVVGGLLWLLVAPVVAGEAAARDVATGMYPLVYTAPLTRAEYLGGRFLAALALNAAMLLAVQAGILLAVYSPGVNPALVAPFRPASYLTAYAYVALPNALVATAIQFLAATRTGRPMASYLGSLFLVFMGFFVASLLFFRRGLGTLLDPVGIRFLVEDVAHLWTTAEKNHRLLALEGVVLTNRLVWLGVAAGALALTFLRFRFAHRAGGGGWMRRARRGRARAPVPAVAGVTARAPVSVPDVPRTFGFALHARQVLRIGGNSFRALASSWAGLATLVFIPLLTVVVIIDQMYSYGTPLAPATGQVLKELTGPLSSEMSRWIIVPLLTIFFAGELVWREREAGVGEIGDAAPVPEWVPFLGKLLGLGLLLAAFQACLMAAGMLAQTFRGHGDFEVGLYLTVLFGLQLPEYLLFAVLALVVHVLVDQKYLGHLAAISLYVVILLAPMFGIEHDMLLYGAGPWWTYTEMRGLGPYVEPWLWFKLYWAAWALLLVVVARLMWTRGREGGFGARLRLARRRLTPATAGTAAVAAGLVLGLGGFVFYNTNVLHEYVSTSEMAARRAEYERRYARFGLVPQPQRTAAKLHVEIHPARGEAEIRGSYRLVNRSGAPIDSIHVATTRQADTRALAFDRPAARVLLDERLGHAIYALETPLQPGDSLRMDFRVHVARRGFPEGGTNASVVPNGTYFDHGWLPAIGYQHGRELVTPGERREHGLAERPVIPSLYDAEARQGRYGGGGTVLETVVGTDADQVAVAPGELRRTWTEGGRRYFHYATGEPIGGEWAFTSARYAVREERWTDASSGRGVAIRILHHPEHTAHLDRWVRSIRASLDYYAAHYGPYRYGHLAVVEIPGDGVGAHAEAGMITHGEGITLLRPGNDPGSLDLPFAIVAHEMAHQWVVPIAFVEGAPVMSESVAWYQAMMVVKHARGEAQLRRLLRWMRQPYPHAPIRRGEPLLRGLDPYMSYRRGPFALYALNEYVGEEAVNGALRRLLETHRAPGAPPATTLDLYRELQAVTPDSLRYLLHDLFEVNTYWSFRTERVTAAPTADGAWRVTLDVRARKVVFDSTGVETEVPMDEWVPVGVFAPAEPGAGELSAPLHLRKHRVRSGAQTITVTVPRRPSLAGIDPHHLLDWEEGEDDDNVEPVAVPEAAGAP
jgi:ABC-2 type transport system permease protein